MEMFNKLGGLVIIFAILFANSCVYGLVPKKLFTKYDVNNTIERDVVESCDCGWANSVSNNMIKIVGGTETGVNEYPAMAALINLNTGSLYCGSHIISDRYLLTAAHCVYGRDPSTFMVLVGEHNISSGDDTPYSAVYYLNAFETHPTYNPTTYANDIAILQTTTQMVFSIYVGPICLPWRYYSDDFYNELVTILGWGSSSFTGPTSSVLLEAPLTVLSNTNCATSMSETIETSQICTYAVGKDSCQSDSGGPVLWTDSTTARMHLVGVISYGVACADGYPGINTRVTSYLDWILDRTSEVSYCYM